MYKHSNDISPDFVWNPSDAMYTQQLLKFEGTPLAIQYFAKICDRLSDHSYWFLLSTLWVSYTGHSDLNLWKELFASKRPKRKTSIMKPSELKVFNNLPYFVTAYRAHRPNETDWIAYTIKKDIAFRFALERGVSSISEYQVKKREILTLFLRRGEHEVLVIDKSKPRFIVKHDLNGKDGDND